MAAKELEITPAEQHFLFACEVIHGLNEFYNIRDELKQDFEKCSRRYVNEDILQAIAIISYVFRNNFRMNFEILKVQKSIGNFKHRCKGIPVRRDDRYSFNFLMRVSVIYEMAVYCYMRINKEENEEESKEEVNYFEIAQNCIAQYKDVNYFQSAGSWSRLNEIASFLAAIGRLLQPVILEERNDLRHLLNFPKTVERIERRLKEQNREDILNSEHMRYLIKRRDRKIAREPVVKKIFTRRLPSTPSEEDRLKYNINCEKQSIMDHLGNFLTLKTLNEEELSSAGFKYERVNTPDLFEAESSSKDTIPPSESNCLTTQSITNLKEKYSKNVHLELNPNFDECIPKIKSEPDSDDYEDDSDWVDCSDMTSEGSGEEGDLSTAESTTSLKVKSPEESFSRLNQTFADHKTKIEGEPGTDENKALWALYGLDHSSPNSDKCSEGGDRTCNFELFTRDLNLSDDESSQQSNVKKEFCNPSPIVKYGLFPSPESNISETQSPREDISSPENNAMDPKLLYEHMHTSESSDDENLHQLNMKNEPCEESSSSVSKNVLISPCSNTDNESFNENEIIKGMSRPMVQPHSSVVSSIQGGVDSNSQTRTEFVADNLKCSSRIGTEQESVIEKSGSCSITDIKDSSTNLKPPKRKNKKRGKKKPCEESSSSVSKNVLLSTCSNTGNQSFHENGKIEGMSRPMVQPHLPVVPPIQDGVDSNSRTMIQLLTGILKHRSHIRTEQENVIKKSESDSNTDIKDSSANPKPPERRNKTEPCEESSSSVSKNVLISSCSGTDNENFQDNEIMGGMLRTMVQPHSSVVPPIQDGADSNSRTMIQLLTGILKPSSHIRTEQQNVIEKSESDTETDIEDSSTNPQPSKQRKKKRKKGRGKRK